MMMTLLLENVRVFRRISCRVARRPRPEKSPKSTSRLEKHNATIEYYLNERRFVGDEIGEREKERSKYLLIGDLGRL